MERALAYVRVSTLKQEADGKNLEGQLAEIRAYCERKGYELADKDVFRDIISGARTDRQGYYDLLSHIETGEAAVIVAYEVSRFGRNMTDNTWLLVKAKEWGLRVETVTGGKDFLENAEAEFMFDILSAVAKYERNAIQARLLRGKRTNLSYGKWVSGPCAYGYRAVGPRGNRRLEPVPEELAVVRAVYERYLGGESLNRIAASLEAGLSRKPARVSFLLKNPVYAGLVHFNGQVAKGSHEAAVPLETWERVKARMAERASKCNFLKRGRPRNSPPPTGVGG